jgi:diaminopimelate decarboxylase
MNHVDTVRTNTSALADQQLMARYGSPLYVYRAEEIRRCYQALTAAFAYRPLALHYAIVCNKNAAIVRLLHQLGAGVHANTPGDAFCALQAGVPAAQIVYSGTNLDHGDFAFLLQHGIHLNLDSLAQLDSLAAYAPAHGSSVGLRLLIDAEHSPNRIGVAPSELEQALASATRTGLRITTLHMYVGTNTRRGSRFVECLERLLLVSRQLPDLACIDIGGGFGIRYQPGEKRLDLAELGRAISQRLELHARELGRPLTLVLEPGRTLVGSAGSLLVSVVSVKERGGRRFVGVDSTVGNLVVPSVYHMRHRVEALSPRGAELDLPTDLCGNTTHSRDFLGRNLRLPELRPGDVLRICDVGAYGYAMSSHFLNRPRPAEVFVDGGVVELTTRRETFADLLSTQAAP